MRFNKISKGIQRPIESIFLESKDRLSILVLKIPKAPPVLSFPNYAIEVAFDFLIVVGIAGILILCRTPTCYLKIDTII